MISRDELLTKLSGLMYRQWMRLTPESDIAEREPTYERATDDHRMIARMRALEVLRLLNDMGLGLPGDRKGDGL
jgi:hypothetical protein